MTPQPLWYVKEPLWAFGGTGPVQRVRWSLNEVNPPLQLPSRGSSVTASCLDALASCQQLRTERLTSDIFSNIRQILI